MKKEPTFRPPGRLLIEARDLEIAREFFPGRRRIPPKKEMPGECKSRLGEYYGYFQYYPGE
ncbi:MAG: hypothetical protein ACOY3J_03760 [Bacillota bacterium]|jgi:hypothetical protein|uniref:Uncharacterized protein n=1 Tax=Thermanaerosceptrum fracticalcis TaxID=1712410 RepID=A0A7G6E7C8_THEFR|nr:hypothetical protein [Thermanaerosceptrum fracticalcis]MBZ4654446.1 hypothetical protein [Peptococcaceae bacterium]QNB47982.1 hypothetical protein BR63_17980 [Thermanaerosceptrum fracticalcis]